MLERETSIALFQGHDIPADGASPIWAGTLHDFLDANIEQAEGAAREALIADLRTSGRHRIGGGAAAAFTLLRIDSVAARRAA